MLPLREGERVQSVLATRDFSETQYLMFATRKGMVKKTEFQAYNTPIKADGIIAINIRDDDELVAVRRVDPGDEILMVSHAGLTVRFREEDARAMGRDTSGVRGMDVSGKDNYVLAMDVARPGPGPARRHRGRLRQAHGDRRVPPDQARRQGRQDDQLTEAKGLLAGALVVARARGARLHLRRTAWSSGPRVRGINRYGRASQGVRVMNLREGDEVSAVALVVETEAADERRRRRRDAGLEAGGERVGGRGRVDGSQR